MGDQDRMKLAEIQAKIYAMASALQNSENPYFNFAKFKAELAAEAEKLGRILKANEPAVIVDAAEEAPSQLFVRDEALAHVRAEKALNGRR